MIEFETVKRIREVLVATPKSNANEKTIAGYKALAKRIIKPTRASGIGEGDDAIGAIITAARMTKSAATWFTRRAALTYWMREMVERVMVDQDKLQRGLKAANLPHDDTRWDAWRKMVNQVGIMAEWIEQLRGAAGPAIEDRVPRHSKRKDMRGLPDDWRERIVTRMPKYRLAVLTEAVTGCRPDELVKGVKLSIEGGYLVAVIEGSKVTEKSGQPWRRLQWVVDNKSPLVAMLVAAVRDGAAIGTITSAKAYSGAVREAGLREWPRRQKTISPYCFRHAAASDMKASGIDDDEISQALGHCVDVARSYYGQWQMGNASGGVAPARIEAARPVRVLKLRVNPKMVVSAPAAKP